MSTIADGSFAELCNTAMVDLETIAPASATTDDDDGRPRQRSVSVDD